MKIVRILAVVLLACLLPRAANAAIIESVSVNVLDRGSTSKVLLERMSASMQTVAEQLLLDKDTEKVEPVRSEYTRLSGRSWGQSPEWISDGAGNAAAGGYKRRLQWWFHPGMK